MKIKFCGAAQTVTGSCHLITTDKGKKILLDCGLYQGSDPELDTFNKNWSFEPSEIDYLILSHSHIDHAGRIPKLVKDGFTGPIISNAATRDLCSIMLMDSAMIQQADAEYENKRRASRNLPPIEPLYDAQDVNQALSQFITIGYNRWFRVNKEVQVYLTDAGHILGSSTITLQIKRQDNSKIMLGFTGDIGRPDRPILKDPQPMPEVDILLMESTYGGRSHPDVRTDENELLEVVKETCLENKGKLMIPAFSVGRTQEIVYLLDRLYNAGKLPKIPIFVDSPLAIDATQIYLMHPDCYDAATLKYLQTDPNPLGFPGLKYTRKVEESMAINDYTEPCIIIASSGMMAGGRIRHHLRNHISNPKNTLLITGFSAPGTLGRKIIDGAKEIHLFGRKIAVNTKIKFMLGFSAHGDEKEMIDFISNQDREKLQKIFLVHGELPAQILFRDALIKTGIKEVVSPELNQEFEF